MAANNVKTAFRLSSGFNEDYQKFNMTAPTTTTASKNINQQQQNIKRFTSGVSKYTQGNICAEVSF